MLSKEAVCGVLCGTRRVSDLSPPRLRPSPTAVTPPFLCMRYPRAPRCSPTPSRCPIPPSSSCLILPKHRRSGLRATAPCPLPLPRPPSSLPPLPLPSSPPHAPPFIAFAHCFSCVPLRWPGEPTTISHPAAPACRSRPPRHPPPSPLSPLGLFTHSHAFSDTFCALF